MQTFGLGEINSELPIEIGDKIRIYEKSFGRIYSLIVTELNDETIAGKLAANPEVVTTVRWDEISRIELRQFDGTETTALVVLLLVLGYAVADVVGDAFDSIGDAFGSNEN